MVVYRIIGPDLTVRYERTKAQAEAARAEVESAARDKLYWHAGIDETEITRLDVPTDHAGLVEFLNRECGA